MTWTRITDQDEAADRLPAWLGRSLIGQRGRFGLLLATGDVIRITSIGAVHMSSDGLVLLDVALDHAGVPDGVDLAWQASSSLARRCRERLRRRRTLRMWWRLSSLSTWPWSRHRSRPDVPTAEEVVLELGRIASEPEPTA